MTPMSLFLNLAPSQKCKRKCNETVTSNFVTVTSLTTAWEEQNIICEVGGEKHGLETEYRHLLRIKCYS
jgi:hypothetical protein